MADEPTHNGQTTNDEKPAGSGKLESMSQEDLIKLVKNQVSLKKKLETKITELTTSNTNHTEINEQLRQQIDDEKSKYSKIMVECDQNKLDQSKLREELHTARDSLECFQLQNETLKSSSHSLQNEISNLQNELSLVRTSLTTESQKSLSNQTLLSRFISTTIDLLQIPISTPDLIDDELMSSFKSELEQKQDNYKQTFDQLEQEKVHLQQRIEDLEFFNEEIKLETDELRTKSAYYEQNKQLMEQEIGNYRRQIEDFEEQFLEEQRENRDHQLITHDKSQQQPSITSSLVTLHQFDENLDDIVSECVDSILNEITASGDQHLSKASSTSSLLLSSDIPTLLHSVGITNCADEEFTVPLNFESVLRLCALLIERCRVLQYILLKSDAISPTSLTDHHYGNDCVTFVQQESLEQCRISIHKHDHIALDTLFERIYTGMNQTIHSNDWQIIIAKAMEQHTSPNIRLEFDHFKFVSEEVEHELSRVRSQLAQVSKETEEQQQEISRLEQRVHSNHLYEQLKERQTQLEEQLTEQCEKTTELENILAQANIDRTKFDQLKQIELSYNELEKKFQIAAQLEGQLKELNENFNEKELQCQRQQELFEKLKLDYDHQHFHLQDRDENIRLLKFELEQQQNAEEKLLDKHQNEISQLQYQFEQQKISLVEATHSQEQFHSSIVKEQDQLKDLIETKVTENTDLLERVLQLENEVKQMQEVITEKNRQIEQFQKELGDRNVEYEELQIQLHQIKEEKGKLVNEINLFTDKIRGSDRENLESARTINDLKQQLETNRLISEKMLETTSQTSDREKTRFEEIIENLKQELELHKTHVQDIPLKQSLDDQTNTITNLQTELETVREENEKRNETIHQLTDKIERQGSDSGENISELKEKYQKMKFLLTRLKKELQDKNQQQPKQSLMDLELADYEKTIQHLRDDLKNKDKEIQDLQDELSNSTERYACLKLEIENSDQQKTENEQRANKFKGLLDAAKKELQNVKDVELQRQHNDDHVRVLIESLQSESDNNKLLINQLQNEKQQLTDKTNHLNETTQRNLNLSEQNYRIVKHDLDIAKQDYETLQDDFNSYKIRAQSVLKQHQSNQRERIPSLADKQAELQETIEKLKTTLREANDKIQSLLSENEALLKEQNRLVEIQAKLMNESRKREQDLRKQYQVEKDQIGKDYSQQLNENREIIKQLTLQNETLSSAFKEQIASMDSDHRNSVSELQNQLEAAQEEMKQLNIHIEFLQETNNNHRLLTPTSESSQSGINHHSSRVEPPAWSVSERQQGEVPKPATRDHQPPGTTDKILEILHATIDADTSSPKPPNDVPLERSDSERQRLEDELNKTKQVLIQTSELLNDSELNNQRLTEQIALLKDEIRRLERNMDRAESISSLEYLKNVILKFFILKSTPERLQLIPVLVTMLKLSPDEQAQLVRVANMPATLDENFKPNESSTQAVPDGATSPSWSSYLNMW